MIIITGNFKDPSIHAGNMIISAPVESTSDSTESRSSTGNPSGFGDTTAILPSMGASPSGSLSGIVGPVIGGIVAIAALIAVVILTALYLIFKTRKHKINKTVSSIMGELLLVSLSEGLQCM